MEPDRAETTAERYGRNPVELLQELRVLRTCVHVLTGRLLAGRLLTERDRVLFGVSVGTVAPVSCLLAWVVLPVGLL